MAALSPGCPGWDLRTPLGATNATRLRSFVQGRYVHTLGYSYAGPTGLAGNKRKIDEAVRRKMVEEDLETGRMRIRIVEMRVDSNEEEKMEEYNAFVGEGGDVGWTLGGILWGRGRRLCEWCFGIVEEG